MNNSNKLQLKFILPWTNHIYIEYDLIVRWPPPIITKTEPLVVHETLEAQFLSMSNMETSLEPVPTQPDGTSNVHYTVVVKGYIYSVNIYHCINYSYLFIDTFLNYRSL